MVQLDEITRMKLLQLQAQRNGTAPPNLLAPTAPLVAPNKNLPPGNPQQPLQQLPPLPPNLKQETINRGPLVPPPPVQAAPPPVQPQQQLQQRNKYAGGELNALSGRLRDQSAAPPQTFDVPDIADVRAQAEKESKMKYLQEQMKLQETERREAEKDMGFDLERETAELKKMQDDVRSYKIGTEFVWGGRPVTRSKISDEDYNEKAADIEARVKALGSIEDHQKPGTKETMPGYKLSIAALHKEKQDLDKLKNATTTKREGGVPIISQIGLIISAAMMARASAKMGRDPTVGIQMIDRFVDRKLQLQQAELNKRQTVVKNQTNFLGQMEHRFKDKRAAMLQTKSTMHESMAAEIGKIQTRVDDAQKQVQLEQLKQNSVESAEKLKLSAQQLELGATKASAEQVFRNKTINMQRDQFEAKQAASKSKAKSEYEKMLVPGSRVIGSLTKKGSELYREKKATVSDISGLVTKLQDMHDEFGSEAMGGWFESDDASEAKSVANEITLALVKYHKLGVISETDKELLEAITGKDPTAYRLDRAMKLLESLLDNSYAGLYNLARMNGYEELEFVPKAVRNNQNFSSEKSR